MQPTVSRAALVPVAALASVAALFAAAAPPARGAQTGAPAAAASATDAAAQRVGKPAPAFALPDQNDKMRSLAEQKGRWVVLAFYPADLTQGCTLQNRSYSAQAARFAPLNAAVFTVSTQDTASKRQFCDKESLTHTLLSDVGGKTAEAYGVLMPGRGFARRVTFYIAPDGNVAAVDTDIKVATAAEDSLATLTKLGATAQGAGGDARVPPGGGNPVATEGRPNQFVGPSSARVTMGALVPDFGLPDAATGKRTALTTLQAGKKATVLIFVSTQCPVSNAYNERMAQLAAQYGPRGVAFAAINANAPEPAAEVAEHARTHRFAFPVLKDADGEIARRFGARVTPEVYVTDGKGVLVYHGAIDDAENAGQVKTRHLAATLDALLAGRPVPAKTTQAFGCTIKFASK
jgi:peroxiredoxin